MEKDNEKISNNEKDKKDSPYSLTLLYYDQNETKEIKDTKVVTCLLYTSPSPRDRTRSRMPSSA